MFYHPEVIVYSMLLPVVCFIVVPAFLTATRVTVGLFKTNNVQETQDMFDQEAVAEA